MFDGVPFPKFAQLMESTENTSTANTFRFSGILAAHALF